MNKQLAELAMQQCASYKRAVRTDACRISSARGCGQREGEWTSSLRECASCAGGTRNSVDELSVIMSELRRGDANDDGDGLPAIAE